MRSLFIMLILFSIFSCDNKKVDKSSAFVKDSVATKHETLEKTSIADRLKRHFELYRIEHSIEINSTENSQTEIQIGSHKINWISTEQETKIKIDNDLFSLKDETTLNIVWDTKDSLNFVNMWDQIKLFKYNDRELIGIRMYYFPCNGLGCSVTYYLIYDVVSKSKSFFGTFRSDNELELFNFRNDEKVDFVSKTFKGDPHFTDSIEVTYVLNSLEVEGKFKVQKDTRNNIHQIKHFEYFNDTLNKEKIEENWITKIK